jgi:hypothetical protein
MQERSTVAASQDDTMMMIEDCEARESRLSDWERSFIDSLKATLTRGGSLSRRQAEALESLWEQATAKG